MATTRECPMCTGTMRLTEREETPHVPGLSAGRKQVIREWVCKDCDYFEEAEEAERKGGDARP